MTTLIPKFDFKNGSTTPADAVNRPINEKLGDIVSALDFDANGADDSARIQAAYNYLISTGVGGTILLPLKAGGWQINTALNFTDSFIPITLKGVSGSNIPNNRPNDNTYGSVLWGNTSNVVIDLSGRCNFGLEDIVIDTYNTTKCPTPSKIGVLGSRTTTSTNNQNHHFTNVAIWMITTGSATNPSIAHYAYGTELGTYENCWYFADVPAVYCLSNVYSITSPYKTLTSTGVSATCNTFNGCKYVAVSGLGPSLYLDGTYDSHFKGSYFLNDSGSASTYPAITFTGSNHSVVIDTFQCEEASTVFGLTGSLYNCSIKGFATSSYNTSASSPIGIFYTEQQVEDCSFNIEVGGVSAVYNAYTGTGSVNSVIRNTYFNLGIYGNANLTAGSGGDFSNLHFESLSSTPSIQLNNPLSSVSYTLNGQPCSTGIVNTIYPLQISKSNTTNNTGTNIIGITVPNANLCGSYLFDYVINSSSQQLIKSGQVHFTVARVSGSNMVVIVSESIAQQSAQATGSETIALSFGVTGPINPSSSSQYAFLYFTANSSTSGTGYIKGVVSSLNGALLNTALVDGYKITIAQA